MPAARHQAEHGPEQAAEQTALRQQMIEVVLGEGAAAAYVPKGPIDAQQNKQIGGGDEKQKDRRHQRADHAADQLERREAPFESAGRKRDRGGREHDDGRVAEREEQADRNRPLAILHQLARHVVDRRDVVGIDGVAQPERVGEKRGADQHRVIVECDQRPRPRQHIGADQDNVEAGDLATEFGVLVVEELADRRAHEHPASGHSGGRPRAIDTMGL